MEDFEITVGDYFCTETMLLTDNKVSCILDPEDELDTQKIYDLNVNLVDMGNAIYHEYDYNTDTSEYTLD